MLDSANSMNNNLSASGGNSLTDNGSDSNSSTKLNQIGNNSLSNVNEKQISIVDVNQTTTCSSGKKSNKMSLTKSSVALDPTLNC